MAGEMRAPPPRRREVGGLPLVGGGAEGDNDSRNKQVLPGSRARSAWSADARSGDGHGSHGAAETFVFSFEITFYPLV